MHRTGAGITFWLLCLVLDGGKSGDRSASCGAARTDCPACAQLSSTIYQCEGRKPCEGDVKIVSCAAYEDASPTRARGRGIVVTAGQQGASGGLGPLSGPSSKRAVRRPRVGLIVALLFGFGPIRGATGRTMRRGLRFGDTTNAGREDLRFADRPFGSLSPLFDRSARRLEGPACAAPHGGGGGNSDGHTTRSSITRSALAQTVRRCRHCGDGRSPICDPHSLSLLPELPQSR